MKIKGLAILLIASLILPLAACSSTAPQYVMYINGQGITAEEYISYCWRFIGEIDPDSAINAASFERVFDEDGTTLNRIITDSALEYILIARFFAEKAGELGISLDPGEIAKTDGEIATLETQYGGQTGYERYLAASGMSAETNREIYLNDRLKNKVTDAMFGEGGLYSPAYDDLADYYSWNYITATHILLLCVDLQTGEAYPEKVRGEALRAAKQAITRYNAGEDFFALIDELGQDSGLLKYPSRSYTFTYGAMTADFERAAYALEPGQITPEPVQTAYGCHVIKRLPLDAGFFEDNLKLISSDYAQAECEAMLSIWKGVAKIEYTPLFETIDLAAYFR